MKKTYQKPTCDTEAAFEILAAACGLNDPASGAGCDPEMTGTIQSGG